MIDDRTKHSISRLRFELEDHEQFEALYFLARFFTLLLVARDGFIRCGDVVLHAPTGETWTVSFADYRERRLSWFGWPEGEAEILDCTLVECCTNEEHLKRVSDWLDKPHRTDDGREDLRIAAVRRLYRPEVRQ